MIMERTKKTSRQRVTMIISPRTLQKARELAARRAMSLSELLAQQIEALVGQDEAYERAERQAMALLDTGFSLGGMIPGTRDEWHER
jgi:hypothetical protein